MMNIMMIRKYGMMIRQYGMMIDHDDYRDDPTIRHDEIRHDDPTMRHDD